MRRVPSGIAVLSLAGLLALLACGGGSSSAPVTALPVDASFGDVDVGGSAARRVELTNTTGMPLRLTAVRSDSGLVTSGEALPLTIAPGETASLSVELAPTTAGDVSGTVEFLAEDQTNPLAVFQATGKGVRPNKLDSSAAVVDFGTVPIGGSVTEEVTLTNGGASSVSIASLTVSAASVSATGLPLPATFAPGESATFTLTYAPTATAPTSGSVVVRAEHGRPATVVQVSGTGVAPSTGPAPEPAPAPATLAAAPTRVDFGQVTVGSFSAQGVNVTNNGSGSITISEVAATGSGFTTSGLTAGTTIAPGASQTLTTRFTPAAQGAASGQVTLRTAGQTEPLAVVELAGSGVAAASITSVTVRDTTVEASKTVQVQADVVAVGTIDKSVRWSVDPASLGTIDPVTGVYSAPAAPGIYRVWATSNADATKRGVGTVTVTAAVAVPEPPPTPSTPDATLPQRLAAFPGCEGAGCYTRGGFNTSVGTPRIFRVTSLATGTGPGTLGECIAASGPRVCTFAVAGTITGGNYVITNPHITIRGDTAPGMGIQLDNNGVGSNGAAVLRVDTNNVVIRGLRVRDGNSGSATDGNTHALFMYPTVQSAARAINNIVIDHCSFSWGNDETIDIYGNPDLPAQYQPRDINLSYILQGEGLWDSTWNTSFGTLISGYGPANCDAMTDIDVHGSYFANNRERNPYYRVKRLRHVNNVQYNGTPTWVEGGAHADLIGNMGRYGPNWYLGYAYDHMIEVNYFYANISPTELNLPGDSSIHLGDNKMYGEAGPGYPGWDTRLVQDDTQSGHATPERRNTRLAAATSGPPIVPVAVDTLPTVVLGAGGAGHSRRLDCGGAWVTAGVRDAVDTRLIDSFFRPPTSYTYPTTPADVGGFPSIRAISSSAVCATNSRDNTSCACADTDSDGIPDYWESAFCGSATGCSGLGTTVAPPWTNLEAFQSGSVVAP